MLERETDRNSRTFSEESGARGRATRTWGVLQNWCERFGQKVVFGIVVLSLVAVEPALAQNAVCDATGLPNMVSGFFQLTTGIGLIGVVVVWQANSLAEMFTLGPDQRERLKQYRRQALKSGVVLVILGPLYSVAGAMMGLPLASCIDLTPL